MTRVSKREEARRSAQRRHGLRLFLEYAKPGARARLERRPAPEPSAISLWAWVVRCAEGTDEEVARASILVDAALKTPTQVVEWPAPGSADRFTPDGPGWYVVEVSPRDGSYFPVRGPFPTAIEADGAKVGYDAEVCS